MAWQDVTSVQKLSVELEDGTSETKIFGNGRNQIGIVVYIEALDGSNSILSLTPEEIIKHSWLIDSVTGERLLWNKDQGWNYTDIENHYHTISKKIENKERPGKIAKFYVQCVPDQKGRNKSISVEVELTNPSAEKKKYSTADHEDFSSKVVISALEAKTYILAGMDFKSEDTANGSHDLLNMSANKITRRHKIKWKQANYYFSIKDPGFHIQHAEISSYNDHEGAYQVSKQSFYNRCPNPGAFRLRYIFNVGYIWPMSDNQQKKNVLLYLKDLGYYTKDIDIQIDINQIPHALCLTRISYHDTDQIWTKPSFWSYFAIDEGNLKMDAIPNITIYDQFGNMGKFHARPRDSDQSTCGDIIEMLEGHHS